MKKIEAKLRYKKHIWSKYEDGSFCYSSCQISYRFQKNNKEIDMDIDIDANDFEEEVCPVFIEVIDFLYLALGTMPLILQYKENGVDIDLSKILTCRFFPSMKFFRAEHLVDISTKTLNEKTLGGIKSVIRSKPFEIFWAFTALTSFSYERIYCEHRISLLLHCFEGYIYNKNNKDEKLTFKERIKEIISVLFEYEQKHNTEILKTFGLSENEYLQKLTDTRHQYSHFMKKPSAMSEAREYSINFDLLHYIFRIFLLREIALEPNEKNVVEFLRSIYDWTNSLLNEDFKDFKSLAYIQKLWQGSI